MDVIQAFDRLEWPFLLAVLKNVDLRESSPALWGPHASSTILLKGRLTGSIPLTRSVRQGCPLSPLLFILAFDILSHLLQEAISNKRIVGVHFPKQDIQTLHNMYVDDLYLQVIRAILSCICELQRILDIFGQASGLVCAWEKTVASVIPVGPPPMHLWLLPWHWESDGIAFKLLGALVAQTIVVEQLEALLLQAMSSVKGPLMPWFVTSRLFPIWALQMMTRICFLKGMQMQRSNLAVSTRGMEILRDTFLESGWSSLNAHFENFVDH